MNIDELMTNIGNVNFDSMTQQEMLDYYQELLDANGELQVRLTDLQETNPKPSQEEFDNVKANMETINSEIERVSDAIQKNAEVQDVEEDFTEINDNDNQLEELERQLNENKKRLEKFDSIVNRNGTSHFKSNRTTRELYERKIKELEREIEEINKLKNQAKEQKEDYSNEIENQIKDLEEKLKLCAERMQKAREEGNEQAYAEERSRYNYLTQEINNLKQNQQSDTKDNSNDVENQIKDLEEKLKSCAERMQKAREEGNEQAYAEERSRYNYLTQEINNLKQNQQSDTKDNSNNVENQIKDLEEKLKSCAERMQKAREEGNEQAYAEERSRYNYLIQEINNLKGQNQQQKPSSDGNDSGNNESENKDKDNDKTDNQDKAPEEDSPENEEKDNEKTEEEKKEERKQKIKKAAIGALGGAIGFGLSFVLQPGTAGTVISVGRLVYSAAKKGLKVYTEKHKDDENNKIIKMVGKVKEFTKEQAEKHPKITSAISKVNNFLKKPETQVFLNGMAAGYTIGKISQAVYKMHEASAMEKKVPTNPEVDKTEPEMMKDVPDIDGTPAPNPTPTPVVTDPTPTFDPTKPVDLSSLGEGYVSSYSSDPVSLITSAGKNAMFDKINVVDGKTWVHFTQGNGAGYAWFPADEVLNALDLSDISELTGEVSGGMHL